jgi:hypothetical protein
LHSSQGDLLNIVLDCGQQDLHVLRFGYSFSDVLVRFWSGFDLALSAVGLVSGFALFAVNVSAVLKTDAVLDCLYAVVAGESVQKGFQGQLQV